MHFEKRVCSCIFHLSFYLSFILIVSQVFIIRVSISNATYIGVINELNVSCRICIATVESLFFLFQYYHLIELLFLFFFYEIPNESNPSSAT